VGGQCGYGAALSHPGRRGPGRRADRCTPGTAVAAVGVAGQRRTGRVVGQQRAWPAASSPPRGSGAAVHAKRRGTRCRVQCTAAGRWIDHAGRGCTRPQGAVRSGGPGRVQGGAGAGGGACATASRWTAAGAAFQGGAPPAAGRSGYPGQRPLAGRCDAGAPAVPVSAVRPGPGMDPGGSQRDPRLPATATRRAPPGVPGTVARRQLVVNPIIAAAGGAQRLAPPGAGGRPDIGGRAAAGRRGMGGGTPCRARAAGAGLRTGPVAGAALGAGQIALPGQPRP